MIILLLFSLLYDVGDFDRRGWCISQRGLTWRDKTQCQRLSTMLCVISTLTVIRHGIAYLGRSRWEREIQLNLVTKLLSTVYWPQTDGIHSKADLKQSSRSPGNIKRYFYDVNSGVDKLNFSLFCLIRREPIWSSEAAEGRLSSEGHQHSQNGPGHYFLSNKTGLWQHWKLPTVPWRRSGYYLDTLCILLVYYS